MTAVTEGYVGPRSGRCSHRIHVLYPVRIRSEIVLIGCARIAAALAGSMVVAGSKISLRFPALLGGGVPKSALFMGTDYPQCAVFNEGSSLPAGPALLLVEML